MAWLSSGDGGSRRHLGLWLLIACLFTLVQVRQSSHGGRLAVPPTFDDVGFLRDGQARLQVFLDQGPLATIEDAWRRAPHSPWSTYLAATSFLVFGMREWAPAAANGLLVLGVLLWLAHRGRRLPLRWLLVAGAVVLTWPLIGQAVENFRPDFACGLVTAALVMFIVSRSQEEGKRSLAWIGARPRRHYLAGLGLALALLIKPTISPVTLSIVLTALAAATLRDVMRARSSQGGAGASWRSLGGAWARCLGTGAVLAAPYYVLAAEHLSGYVYRNTFGELKNVWSPRLEGSEHATYYLTGGGGRLMLGSWLYLWLALAGVALAVALARSDRAALSGLPVVGSVIAVSYALVTLPAHKNPFLGAVLPCLLLFVAIEMMVYLATERPTAPGAASKPAMAGISSVVGRWLLVALLVLGVAGFRWPSQQTTGGLLAPAEQRQHRELLETVYRDLRHVGGEKTRVFFTQVSAFLNPVVLEYRAGLDRLDGFVSRDLQLTESQQPLALNRELTLADHVVAFSPGNRNAMDWLPGAETQSSILGRLGADPEFVLAGIYGTPGGGEVYLFTRATGFRGIRPLAGFGPLEGPYPQWGLHTRVRWAMGPVSRFEVRLPSAARVRLTWDGRGDFPDQAMTLKISGRVIARHPFGAPGVFERHEAFHDLVAGRHLVELEHSHWHDPSAQDDRPRAVLLRTLTVLPFFEASSISGQSAVDEEQEDSE